MQVRHQNVETNGSIDISRTYKNADSVIVSFLLGSPTGTNSQDKAMIDTLIDYWTDYGGDINTAAAALSLTRATRLLKSGESVSVKNNTIFNCRSTVWIMEVAPQV